MKRIIIGTAGHIDHGKTTLVKALTGHDTDRLKEEKKRGISIELGFAPFTLPNGQKAAIVDVPGHERFIRHMLAGAFGIDLVLLTIAADEGIMPQTREHMDIIELLGVDKGIVVLTKKDLVDEEWLMLVEDEIEVYLKKSILSKAPIIAVSAVTGEGIDELKEQIEILSGMVQEKSSSGYARLPIDRVFSMSGFGTVVTGTLWSGKIGVGESLELMPPQKQVKIRTIQIHNVKTDVAFAGQRVAVNLQGIELNEIKRGYLLTTPGSFIPSYRLDTRLRLLSGSNRIMHNWNRIRFHLGTDEVLGRIVLLDRDELNPGEEAFAQIILEKQIVAHKGDPFVIRYYSPVSTIGGGTVIEPNAAKQKRFKEEVLEELAIKEEGSLYEMLLHEMTSAGQDVFTVDDLARKTGSHFSEQLNNEIQQLIDDEQIVEIKQGIYISQTKLDSINEIINKNLLQYHKRYPLRSGYPKEDMRSKYFSYINGKNFNAILKLLEEQHCLISKGNDISRITHQPTPGEKERRVIDYIVDSLNQQLFNPPSIEEIKNHLAVSDTEVAEALNYLVNQGQVVKLEGENYFSKTAIEEGKVILEEYFRGEQELSLATARDLLETSRKYTLPLVEYYDKIRFTRRIGDIRIKAK
ncbi:MAG TPA: selenocysteine-specific translation elongation factor [Syntrophomonadaceae bacterium]|nr:selenocysteine-specific translation elongation factor [Syntrophomonadaceae bacterium]HPR93974.1 selenocysteine-specific translation elongation factor [Syntrophomonadaceae bacterium]